ncbi:unnamed protein product [Lupinus luteus]|uniref:Uncharacterized protein n=1 Tax=Lupinus luteus TaxID=3873 RepID=A0AAV1Y3J1_LUPLU
MSNQQIFVSLVIEDDVVFLCGVYAHRNYIHRRLLWSELKDLMNKNMGPWCCIGDFNMVMGANECRGSTLPARMPIEEFRAFSDDTNLIHLTTRGVEFTWSNKRRGMPLTEKRLDRSICNEDWLSIWSQVFCCTLPKSASDHHPLLLKSSSLPISKHSHFRFHRMWLNHSDCRRVVLDCWKTYIIGCHMNKVSQNLKILKRKLIAWNVNVFGNLHLNVQNAMASVEDVQSCITLQGPVQELLDREYNAQMDLIYALKVEEEFWMEKARLNWHTSGDRNTGFFQKVAKIRQTSKNLSILKDGELILSNQNDLANHALRYFLDLYASSNITCPNNLIGSTIPNLVLEEDNLNMTKLPSYDEIKSAVFYMNGDGAPLSSFLGHCGF